MRKQTIKVECDLCSNVIGEFCDDPKGRINILKINSGNHFVGSGETILELCDECLSRFKQLINQIIKESIK